MSIVLEKAGPQTLVQDQGRIGFFRQGITSGGPMDRQSFDWANRLLGNMPGTTALEIALGNVCLVAQTTTAIAVTGASGHAAINGVAIDGWRGYRLEPGDRLTIGSAQHGVYFYLAVAGGFQVSPTLGSTSTVVREQLGGLDGKALKNGDSVPCKTVKDARLFALPTEFQPDWSKNSHEKTIRIVPGFQSRQLGRNLKKDFYAQHWHISSESNRMGYRLSGNKLPAHGFHLTSEGIVAGSVQIPPDGQPIIMMRDHQTIGGYPKLGVVCSVDLSRLAQTRAGQPVCFRPITASQARALLFAERRNYEATCPISC